MNRVAFSLCLIIAVGLTIAGSGIQGYYNNRWGMPIALPIAGEKLATVPENFGDWRMKSSEPWGPQVTNMLHCAGHISRVYENLNTYQTVNLAVLVGPPGPTSQHIPEICYSSKAYDIESERERFSIARGGGKADEFWGLTFRSLDAAVGLLRVAYAWSAGESWVAPDSARLSMRKHRVLYKIQLASPLPAGADLRHVDPCREFLNGFLPVLQKAMVKPSSE